VYGLWTSCDFSFWSYNLQVQETDGRISMHNAVIYREDRIIPAIRDWQLSFSALSRQFTHLGCVQHKPESEKSQKNVLLYSAERVLKMSLKTRSLAARVTLNMWRLCSVNLASISCVQHVKLWEQTCRWYPAIKHQNRHITNSRHSIGYTCC